MAKSSPEKLSQALRANLKRRKQPARGKAAPTPPEPAPQPANKPPKKSA
jgi:hypothetical protein